MDEMKRNIEKALNDIEGKAQIVGLSPAIDAAFNLGVQLAGEAIIEEIEKFDGTIFVDYPILLENITAVQNRLKI